MTTTDSTTVGGGTTTGGGGEATVGGYTTTGGEGTTTTTTDVRADVHVIVDTVDESLFDAIVARCNPSKIVAFVTAEEEDSVRCEYERIYHRFGDTITLYAGHVPLLFAAYVQKYPRAHFYDCQGWPVDDRNDDRNDDMNNDRNEE